MQWYWYVLIFVALAGMVFVKIKVGGAWLKKQSEKKALREKALEDED